MSKYLERLYYLLPKNFRNADLSNRQQLKRFLDIIVEGGFGPLHEETRNILSLIDFDRVPAEYLPYLASALGFKFPYDLDEQTQRTYVKNAVKSYRMKGTETALTFMIRELTRFKTDIQIDEENRRLDVRLEVDMGRQDFNKVVDKVDFLVREYAPPFKEYNLVNTFLWFEDYHHEYEEEVEGLITFGFTPYENQQDNWFVTNVGMTNSDERPLFSPWEEYLSENLSAETLEKDLIQFLNIDEETFLIKRKDLFFTNDSLTNDPVRGEIITSLRDDELADTIGLSFNLEAETVTKKPVYAEEVFTIQAPMNDYATMPSDWLITGSGLTNEAVTGYGETYFADIQEETIGLLEMEFAVEEERFDTSELKFGNAFFMTNTAYTTTNDAKFVTGYMENDSHVDRIIMV